MRGVGQAVCAFARRECGEMCVSGSDDAACGIDGGEVALQL